MNLHANAALSLNRRRQLCRARCRGAVDGDEGGRGRRSQRPLRPQVGGSLSAEGELGLLDRSSAPSSDPASHERGAGAGDRGAPAFAVHRPGDRRDPRDGALDGLGDPARIGMGKLGRLGLEPAVRYERERPGELIHIDVKKLGQDPARAPATASPATAHYEQPRDRTRRCVGARRLGVRAHRDRRLHPPGLRRGPRRREGHHRRRVPAPRRRVLSSATA